MIRSMIKKHFHDGLLQLALLLSLLRVDLHTYLNNTYSQDIEEFVRGPTSAFTQTRFHHNNWNDDVGGYIHPKHVDVDRNIHDVIRDVHTLGYFRHIRRVDIEAYLVSDPQPQVLLSENAEISVESGHDGNNNQQNSNGTLAAVATEAAANSFSDHTEERNNASNGSELTKEDMDLIDILWKQDMDLGVGREVFDGNLRREMEKQRELELQKQNASVEQKVVPPPQAMNFTVDSETGEMIPQPAGPTPQDPQLPPAANNAGQFLINNAPVETVPPQNANLNLDQNFQIFDRQNSFEERWADVENILNITPNTTEPDAGTPPEHALLRNATLVSTNASDTAQIGLLGNNTGFDFNNTDFMNQMNNNTTLFNMDNQSLVFNNASQILQNATLNNTNFNNQSLLDELLREDFDLDTIDLDQAEMKLECDSAMGSSVAGSVSPVASMNDSSSNSTSYDGMEGATGGSHDNKLTLKEEPFDPSYKYSDFTEYSDDHMRLNSSGFSSDDPAMELETGDIGDPAQVAHNHTYVLQPGQRPRERKQTPEEKQALAQMSRDEKKAKNMKIPISMDDIVNSPVEEFNEILQRYKLSDAQLNLIRDIRRRGKNKVAAQNCRKRKMEVINSLEDEVNAIRRERDRLQREKHQVNKQANEMKRKYDHLYEEVFRSLRDDNGQPYDPSQYSLQQTPDGNVFLVPVNSTSPARDHEEKHTHKRKGKKGGH